MSPNETEYKSPIGRKILAIFALIAGAMFLISAIVHPAYLLGAITFLLPALWWFAHERKVKADPTAPRLKRHWGIIAAISAVSWVACLLLAPVENADSIRSGFVPEVPAPTSTTSTTTSSSSTTSSTVTSSSTTAKATTDVEEQTPDEPRRATSPAPAPQQTQQAPAEQTPAEQAEKAPVVIDHCGDITIHAVGTTFYSDGTTGWTQECTDKMNAQIPARQPAPAPIADPTPAPAPDPAPAPAPAGDGGALTCKDIGHKTRPGDGLYRPDHDSNGDGVGCEDYPG